MLLNNKNGIIFFRFPNLADYPEIWHGIFTRRGGYSKGQYKSLNISFEVGDDPEIVEQNRNIIEKCIERKGLVFVKQKHGTEIIVLTKNNNFNINMLHEGDAIITDIINKYLVIQVADCQPLLLYDPVKRVVANIHSGWRGSIKNIIEKTIIKMQKIFSCKPINIIAGIGPSLGPCCAEFINYKKEIPSNLWKYKNNYNFFDFWALSRDQLINAGVLIENIHLSEICTKCNTNRFFSFRKQRITGRFASIIGLI